MERELYKREDVVNQANQGGEKHSAHFFEFGSLKFAILYERECFAEKDHFGFMSMSTGLEKISETGYKSVFVNSQIGEVTKEEIGAYWIKYALEEGINLLNPVPRQLELF